MNRFQTELKGDNQFMLDDIVSVEELLAQTRALQPPAPRGSKIATSLSRLEPILSHINDFAAVIAVCSGADAKAAGLVWGSLRVILTVRLLLSLLLIGDMLNDTLVGITGRRYARRCARYARRIKLVSSKIPLIRGEPANDQSSRICTAGCLYRGNMLLRSYHQLLPKQSTS
jgi:hypothetical protein